MEEEEKNEEKKDKSPSEDPWFHLQGQWVKIGENVSPINRRKKLCMYVTSTWFETGQDSYVVVLKCSVI